jgi:hypothetical protein
MKKHSQKINDILKLGFSKRTLSVMTESQISALHNRLVNESGSVKVKKGTSPEEIKSMTDKGINVELIEKKSNKSTNLTLHTSLHCCRLYI